MSDPAPTTTTTTTAPPVRTVDGLEVPVTGTYAFDPAHTHIGFVVRHMMVAKVRGRFTGYDGKVVIADGPVDSTVEVAIDAASIDTRDEQRDTHLRSADFFDVENFPQLTFASTKITHARGDEWTVDGELTIHGVTRPVTLDVQFEGGATDPWGNTKIGFSASGEIDRDEFGLSWNVALEAGGWLVGRTIKLEIEAELIRQG
jgi:polyisoprenoid-binding protein YceI